ncbi:HKD family nuclease [Desulfitispora alkaliphila]|uniref:DEAD/DEAH box helicase family protein n=1 Tax=Desulfitispora alkaliphila TaxID=622674 RepID=UPI003D218546
MSNAIVGNDEFLINHLTQAINRSEKIRFNVAFLMESGVKLLGPQLREAIQNGVELKILTGSYMSVTEPSAIYYLLDILNDNVDIRFFDDKTRSFHPKAYIFDYGEDGEIFVGSSNVSKSALISGIEWNYKINKHSHQEDYQKFSNTFDTLFNNHAIPITPEVLKKYASTWKKSSFVIIEDIKQKDDVELEVHPRGAQLEALYELKKAREEGVKKGMIVAATGVGKTYLAAFDSIDFEKVLFVAHREEILLQAEEAFKTVRPGDKTGFFMGSRKEDGQICFATIQTLARNQNIKSFSRDQFDYIIIDEFHHAAADSYIKVLEYFKPDFLLGLNCDTL